MMEDFQERYHSLKGLMEQRGSEATGVIRGFASMHEAAVVEPALDQCGNHRDPALTVGS